MNWVAGLYYLGIDTKFTQGLAGSGESVVVGPSLEFNTITSMKTDSYSIFGQLDYSLTPSLVGVARIRYIREEKSLLLRLYGFLLGQYHQCGEERRC